MTSAEKRYRTALNLWDETFDGFEDSKYSVPIFPRNNLILKKDGENLIKYKITNPEGLYEEYKRRQVEFFKIMLDPNMQPFVLGGPTPDAFVDPNMEPFVLGGPVPDALSDTDLLNLMDASNLTSNLSDFSGMDSFSVEESSRNDTDSSWQDFNSSSNDDDDDFQNLWRHYKDVFQNLWRPSQSEVEPRVHPLKNTYVKDKKKQKAIQYFGDEFLYAPNPAKNMKRGIVVERIGTNYYYLYKTNEEDWRLEYAQQLTTRV